MESNMSILDASLSPVNGHVRGRVLTVFLLETLQSSWRCSVCRRKIASRDQPMVAQESTDSMLDVPCLETLHRRHSDARLGPTGNQIGALGSGLAPPRSPEIRRHSDVSPASLKELEKVSKNLIHA